MASTVLMSTHRINKSYGSEPLFTDISLQIFGVEKQEKFIAEYREVQKKVEEMYQRWEKIEAGIG